MVDPEGDQGEDDEEDDDDYGYYVVLLDHFRGCVSERRIWMRWVVSLVDLDLDLMIGWVKNNSAKLNR